MTNPRIKRLASQLAEELSDSREHAPVAVEIVDRKRTASYYVGQIFGKLAGGVALAAWLVMLELGGIHSQYQRFPHPAYWVCILGVLAVRTALPSYSQSRRVLGPKVK